MLNIQFVIINGVMTWFKLLLHCIEHSCFAVNSRREPEEPEDATKGRDVFNEKPPPEELLAVSDLGKAVTSSLPDNVVVFFVFQ